jgi:O-antigen biosynthesis protein
MNHRRAGAPRLIEWTGERAVPWAPDINVIYEHYHRYLWAGTLVAGMRVLDIGSGEGYGSALLAATAQAVVGVDTDPRTVEHSLLNYAGHNLSFDTGSATDLSAYPDGSFDAVVAFEILEHLTDQTTMLREIRRVLTEDGFLVMSTPDRRAYTDATGQENPFHVHELSEPEFRALLDAHFVDVCLFGQRSANGSRIESLDSIAPAPSCSFALESHGDDWQLAGSMSPLYLIAVASRSKLPALSPDSTLSDFGLAMFRAAEREAVLARAHSAELEEALAAASQHGLRRDAELTELASERALLDAQLTAATRDIADLEAELVTTRQELSAACVAESKLNDATAQLSDMTAKLTSMSAKVTALSAELSGASAELSACRTATGRPRDPRPLHEVIAGLRDRADALSRIRGSHSYAAIERYRRLVDRVAPAESRRRSAYRALTAARRRS